VTRTLNEFTKTKQEKEANSNSMDRSTNRLNWRIKRLKKLITEPGTRKKTQEARK